MCKRIVKVKRWWVAWWPWIIAVIVLVLIYCILEGLYWLVKGEGLPTQINLFVGLGAFVISVAAVAVAHRSLLLARATARPFLNVDKVHLEEATGNFEAALRVTVKNTGNLPAEGVVVDIFLRDYNDKYGRGMPLNEDMLLPSLCFPGESVGPSRHELSADQRRLLTGNFAVIKITYRNRDSKEQHETVRGFWVSPSEEQDGRRLESPKGFVPQADLESWK